MKTKKDREYSYNHVNERLTERFGLSITKQEFNDLSNQFGIDKNNLIQIENEDQEIHQISFKGSTVTFVYSRYRDYITTAMDWS